MGIRDRLSSAWYGWNNPDARPGASMHSVGLPGLALDDRDRYEILRLYKENRVYHEAQQALMHVGWPEDYNRIKALENPSLQAVRFHVIHVFPGQLTDAMPIVGEDAQIEAARAVFLWSNMGGQKDALIEDQATYGDVFLKAVVHENGRQVYLDGRHPREVTEFKEDNLRNIKLLRLDVELEEKGPNDTTWWTEYWDHEQNLHVAWYHKQGPKAKLDLLGTAFDGPRKITDFGHDFVPFVRMPFNNGSRPNQRSRGVFELNLEAIDDLNRNATHARDMWRENAEGVWAALRNESGEGVLDFKNVEEPGPPEEYNAHKRRLIRFPGVSRMEDLVPKIDYGAALDIDENSRRKLEYSMAELRYFRGHDKGDPSAAAMRQHMGPAMKSAESARGAAEDAVLKGLKMCFTMGKQRKLFTEDVGSYESGTFDTLNFKPRAIFPESPTEKAARELAQAEAYSAGRDVSPEYMYRMLIADGYEDEAAREIANNAPQQSDLQRLLNGGVAM